MKVRAKMFSIVKSILAPKIADMSKKIYVLCYVENYDCDKIADILSTALKISDIITDNRAMSSVIPK